MHETLEAYKAKLPAGTGVRLITKSELERLGCVLSDFECSGAPAWVYSTSYYSGSAADEANQVIAVSTYTGFTGVYCNYADFYGVRPVIELAA